MLNFKVLSTIGLVPVIGEVAKVSKNVVKDKILKKLSCSFEFNLSVYRDDIERHILKLYPNIIRDNKAYLNYIIDPSIYRPKVILRKALPSTDITFVTIDKFTICKIEYVTRYNRYICNKDDSENTSVKVTFIGRMAYVYMQKILRKITSSRLPESNYVRSTIDTIGIDKRMNDDMVSSMNIDLPKESDVILPDNVSLEPLIKFIHNKDIYDKYNITYKFGILMYGIPGCGKTSTIKLIIRKIYEEAFKLHHQDEKTIVLPVNIINMSSDKFIDNAESAIRTVDRNYRYSNNVVYHVIILEEIDILYGKRSDDISVKEKRDISALMQMLDGFDSVANTIVIATTNYIEKLDDALIRDSRFDLKMEFKPFERPQAEKLCEKFNQPTSILDGLEMPIVPSKLQNILFNSEYLN